MDDDSRQEDLPSTELRETQPEGVSGAPGDHIGSYRLLDKLGEGGMGEVWLAEQTEPVKRKVALKVIKQGMDTKQVVARFEAERQALAMMDHPAIAKVYDAGGTPQGRPYFAMEHVKGVPITEHCDRQKLSNRKRLELFMQVCEGVQHAHQKAVIHRDLKPGNVLVSIQGETPVPKIIDFGVAKATAQRLTDKTMHTQLGVLIGTPAYMSPEQAEMTGQDIDTRTDVYALGVMLYELLVGALPFDPGELRASGLEAMVRKIREDEPPRPSIRLTTLGEQSTQSAEQRNTELPALKRELSGDLDWITLKALEKDRTRRYGSPQDLAADIQRYLNDQPVSASPPSVVYRARKFVKRHTWGVAAATIGVVVLIAFAGTMAYQAKQIADERDAVERANEDLESVVEFQAGMLSGAEPQEMGRRLMSDLADRIEKSLRAGGASEQEITSALHTHETLLVGVNATDLALRVVDEDILARALAELRASFGERPLIDARLRATIANTYRTLGIYDRAEPLYLETLETRKRLLGEEHPDTLRAMSDLGGLYWRQLRRDEAEEFYSAVLEARRRVLGEEHPDTLDSMTSLGNLYRIQGRNDEAEPLLLAAVESVKRVHGDDHPKTLGAVYNLALLYESQGRIDEAEPLALATLESSKRVHGDDHSLTLAAMNNVANLYWNKGRVAEAERLFVETLEGFRRVYGNEHGNTQDVMFNLAHFYMREGRYSQAEPLFLESLEIRERVFGIEHVRTTFILYKVACLRAAIGDRAGALDWLRQAVEAGYSRGDWLARDPDLEPIHGREFDALVARARENAASQR